MAFIYISTSFTTQSCTLLPIFEITFSTHTKTTAVMTRVAIYNVDYVDF